MPEGRKATALLELHRQLGARLTEFSGWEMPLQYSGVVAEHRAVRGSAGLFDVSHLGKLRIRGEDGGRALQHSVTADVTGLDVGRAGYALVLTEDAGTVDDLFVYRTAEDEWLVVPNAANVEAVASCLRASGGEPEDEWDRWTILALQGPRSFEKFDTAFPGTGAVELALHSWKLCDLSGEQAMVARTGYTGEPGFELYVPSGAGVKTFRRLLDVGVAPVGLGARDTLRLEMGYALYGHELTRQVNPLEAKLGWAIDWAHDFRGRARLLEVKETGIRRTVAGIRCTGRGIPREGHEVRRGSAVVGSVTSGNFSPTLGTGIALARVEADAGLELGDHVEVAARERMIAGDIVKPPFIRKPRSQK